MTAVMLSTVQDDHDRQLPGLSLTKPVRNFHRKWSNGCIFPFLFRNLYPYSGKKILL